jgi:hypothetical protein
VNDSKWKVILELAIAVFLATSSTFAQNLDFNGEPFVPQWGTGTMVRANDSPEVYVADRDEAGHVRLTWINPTQLNKCYGGKDRVIWVLSQALHQPSVVVRNHTVPDCVEVGQRSVGSFNELYEPGSDGARHIAMTAWTNAEKTRMQGIIRYESDTNLRGICGGAVVGLVDSENHLLHFYTPPSGCGNGKFGGHAAQRFVAWEDGIPEAVRSRVASVRVAVVFTKGEDKGENIWQSIQSIGEIIGDAAQIAKVLGVSL